MRHFLIVFVFLAVSLVLNAQSMSYNSPWNFTDRRFSFEVGAGYFLGKHGDLPINLNIGFKRWVLGVTVGLGNFWDLEGKNYTGSLSWNEYPGDKIKSVGRYNQLLDASVGYHIWKNISAGIGLGYAFESIYKNMYDKSHILSTSGNYYVKAHDKGRFAGRVFVNCYIPLEHTGSYYLVLSPQYSTYYNFGASVGIGFAFR